MKKEKDEYKEDDTIIDNEFIEPFVTEKDYKSKPKIISFISEFMSLSLNEKKARYLINNKIRQIKNPITLDTLIHYLCINDENYPLIELMKPNSIEMEEKNKLGQTLLHIAVQNKSFKITKYLIENGADVHSKDKKNNTPLNIAAKNEDYNIIELLMKYNSKKLPLNKSNESLFHTNKKKNNKNSIFQLNNSKHKNNDFKKEKYYYCSSSGKKKNDYLYKYKTSNSNIQNYTTNNCSLETKNETNNQSFNIYKKKIISKEKENKFKKKIKTNQTISLNNIIRYKENTPDKKYSFNSINRLSPIISKTRFVYRKTSPKLTDNNKNSFNEFDKDSNITNYKINLNLRNLSPDVNINASYFSFKTEDIGGVINHKTNMINNIKLENIKKDTNIRAGTGHKKKIYSQVSYNNNESNNNRIKKVRKTIIHNTPFVNFNLDNIKKQNFNKDKLLEFLKEIGMQQYGDLLISEGFDDINLIIYQMKEGFPILDDSLREIGITCPGDRAKILIRIQEVSNEFNFDFPFEQVYFKNNHSIQRWLNKERLSKYINNFINAGYQSLELLLIQMASKFKLNDKFLKNEIHIINDEDRKFILKSLEKNSEIYVSELSKNKSVKRTYSKMVKKNDESICIII